MLPFDARLINYSNSLRLANKFLSFEGTRKENLISAFEKKYINNVRHCSRDVKLNERATAVFASFVCLRSIY